MAEPNYTENQKIWDEGQPSLLMCYRKGWEHGGYRWGSNVPTRLSLRHQDEYLRGYANGLAGKYEPPST